MGKTKRKIKRAKSRGVSTLTQEKITRINRSCYNQALAMACDLADGKIVSEKTIDNFRSTSKALALEIAKAKREKAVKVK